MQPFTYQKWKKRESERKIINALREGDKRFSELLQLTELSKPVLSERLNSLAKQSKVEIVPEIETKRFLYHLIYKNLDDIEKGFVLLHRLSEHIVRDLVKSARDSSISDEEYTKRLLEGVAVLFNLRMTMYHTITPIPVQKEFLKTTVGVEFVTEMPKLFPEDRDISPYILDGMSPKEQAIYKSKETREAAKRVLEYLEMNVEKLSKKST